METAILNKKGFEANRNFIRHLFAILIVVIYEQSVVILLMGKVSPVVIAVDYCIDIPFFYLFALLIIPKIRRMPMVGVALLCIFTAMYIVLFIGAQYFMYWYADKSMADMVIETTIRRGFGRLLHLMLIAFAYYQVRIGFKRAIEANEERELRIGLENANFKSQLNSHLLFNTLWFVYTLVVKVSERAAKTIMLLSDVLRYIIKTAGSGGKVFLKDEVNHVQNYIELLRIRTLGEFYVNFKSELKGMSGEEKVPPGVLSNFIANAFKHGVHNVLEEPIIIFFSVDNGFLNLHTHNIKGMPKHESGGLGMKHIIQVLEQWYKGRYELNIEETESHYDLHFSMEL